MLNQNREGLVFASSGMQGLGARQATIDYHLETARRCLALSISQRPLLSDDPGAPKYEEEVVEQARNGSRIAAKIIHLRNLTATLAPVPATTDSDQYSVFDRFCAGVETLWSDRHEHGARDPRIDSGLPRLLQLHIDPPGPPSRRSSEILFSSTPRHRRAGSSRI